MAWIIRNQSEQAKYFKKDFMIKRYIYKEKRVHFCEDCPNSYGIHENVLGQPLIGYGCSAITLYRKIVHSVKGIVDTKFPIRFTLIRIPDWCPLEDVKENHGQA